ncbi:MAG TPA: hypothetical protein VFW19_08360 [Allosphingosinicella sp.]|nr:hypothetical protein [Allosphingosinicella sp.]
MAILAMFTGDGTLTADGYDKLREELHWHEQHPQGGIVHIASFDETGAIHVADVWSSAEELDAFARNRLMPALARMGVTPPRVEIYPVHNMDAYAAVDAFKVA